MRRDTPLIKKLPLTERPEQRLRDHGPAALSTSELLACLLQTPNALFQAQERMCRFGLHGLRKTSIPELCQVSGIGPSRAVQIRAALELGRRSMLEQPSHRYRISSPADAASLLLHEMNGLDQEHLVVINLDTKNRVLSQETQYIGNANTSVVRVAEVFRPAIRQNASAIILSHNHPSGDPSPSPEDVRVTHQIVEAGNLLDVALFAFHFLLLGFTEARHHSPSYLRWIEATFLHAGHHIPHHLRHHFRHHLGNGLSGEGYDQPPAYCAQESSEDITPAVRNRIVHLSCPSLSC
jgi:DNA repair protein RadC